MRNCARYLLLPVPTFNTKKELSAALRPSGGEKSAARLERACQEVRGAAGPRSYCEGGQRGVTRNSNRSALG